VKGRVIVIVCVWLVLCLGEGGVVLVRWCGGKNEELVQQALTCRGEPWRRVGRCSLSVVVGH
jgi:hypothetical protein